MLTIEASLDASGLTFGLAVSRFNDLVTRRLLEGAEDALKRHGADTAKSRLVWASGAVELSLIAKTLAASGDYDAVLALGCVIRGATSHYDYVCGMVSSGLNSAALETGVPVIFGVLTTDTLEQALERAGSKAGNKGAEAAVAAIEMANLMKALRPKPPAKRRSV